MMYNSWHKKELFFFKFCVLGYKTILAVYSAQGWEFAHSFIFGERTERFAHIAHQKWGNKRITHFFKEKNLYKTY